MSEYMSKNALESLGSADSDDILLREALAIFLAKFVTDYKNEDGTIISKTINEGSEKHKKYVDERLIITYWSIVTFVVTIFFNPFL